MQGPLGFPSQERRLALQSPTVAAERAVTAHDPMAGNPQRHRVGATSRADGTDPVGNPQGLGHPTVAGRFPPRDVLQEAPDPSLEGRPSGIDCDTPPGMSLVRQPPVQPCLSPSMIRWTAGGIRRSGHGRVILEAAGQDGLGPPTDQHRTPRCLSPPGLLRFRARPPGAHFDLGSFLRYVAVSFLKSLRQLLQQSLMVCPSWTNS